MAELGHPVQQRPGEDRTDIRSLVEVLIRRRWIILTVALPVIVVAAIGTLRSTQTFRARSTIMLEFASPKDPQFGRRPVDYTMALSAAAELGMSAPVAKLAAEALADSIPVLRSELPEWFADVETVGDLAGIIQGGANSTHVGESNLLNLSMTHPSARFALMGAEALSDAFISFSVSTKQNSPAVEYYSEQIAATQSDVDSLMTIRARLIESAGIVGMRADLEQAYQQIWRLENEYFTARTKREGLESVLRELRAAIAADPDFVPAVAPSQSASLSRLKGEYDTQRVEMAELLQTYHEDSQWVQRLQRRSDALREDIRVERDRYVQSLAMELAEAQSVEDSYRSAYQQLAESVSDYPEVQGRLETLDMELDSMRELLLSLHMKRGEVRMSANSDLRVSDILLVEEPMLDVPIGRGRSILYLIISVVLSIAMGLVAAFFVESNDHRIYDSRRAEMYLEVPVLGSLPDASGEAPARR